MVHRRLGKTDLSVSPLGFGAFKIGRNRKTKYPHGYDLPDETTVAALLNGILDLGINLIDTAPAYGLSEERIGAAIAHRRSEYVVSTKVGEAFVDGRSSYDFCDAAIRRSLQRSLRRLRTDSVDILLIHSDGNDLEILRQTDAVETLHALRHAGLTGAIGFSGKTVDGARAALAWADVVMVEYHLEDQSHGPVIAEAAHRSTNVGVLVKKGLASGRLDPREAIPFVLSNEHVGSLVLGGLDLDHFRSNVELATAAGR